MSRRIWITWENQRRNITLSSALGAKLFQFDIKCNWIIRYFLSSFLTIITFIKQKPTIIFVQNPSIVLALLATIYGRLFNIPIIVDAHNAGIYPFEGTKTWANKLSLYLFKASTITIVSNQNLKNYVIGNGGSAFVLPDPIPEFAGKHEKTFLKGKYNLLFICTYSDDEPYMEVIKAAENLDKDVFIYITGNPKDKEQELMNIVPENVILTGYLIEKDFQRMLFSVDVIIDLTTREDCIVCGAYEALAVEKPLIISDTKVLREYFYKGTIYTDNTHTNLTENIVSALHNNARLHQQMSELKVEVSQRWNKRRIEFEEILQKIK